MKIGLALSGGVDSAVAAAILKLSGNEVTGYHMVVLPETAQTATSIRDARLVAAQIGITLEIIDLRIEFKEIMSYFSSSYRRGRTPNPCAICNDAIKFGAFRKLMFASGEEAIATGHYARILSGEAGELKLARGIDERKDQSYFLARIKKEKLASILFPLGGLTKESVREKAREFNLPIHSKRDSQEICFIAKNDYRSFLELEGVRGKVGEIVNDSGLVLGKHAGLTDYTVGQRKGLGVSADSRLYVKELDVENNRVVLARREELIADRLLASEPNWYSTPQKEFACLCKIRSSMKAVPAHVRLLERDVLEVAFPNGVWGVAPGQLAVFYDGPTVIGSAFIEGN